LIEIFLKTYKTAVKLEIELICIIRAIFL